MKPFRWICSWLFLFSFACSSTNKETDSQPETPKTETAAKTQTASVKNEPKTVPDKIVETPPAPTIPKMETSSVLFVVTYGGEILPLACYDTDKKKFMKEKACLSLPALGDSVKVTNGKSLTIKKKTEFDCEPSGDLFSAFSVEKSPEEELDFDLIAFWPESAAKSFISFPEVNDDKGAKSLKEDERERLLQAVKEKAPKLKTPMVLKQSVSLDLDGDGTMDQLYSIIMPEEGGEGEEVFFSYGFSGLFFANGKTPETLQLILSSSFEYHIVDGYTDLDGDGIPELWLSIDYYEGGGDSIVHWKNDKLVPLGSWGCGA